MRRIDADALMGRIIQRSQALITPNGKVGYLGLFVKDIQQVVDDAPTINPEDCRPQGRWSETNWASHDGHDEVITHYEITALKCSNCCCCFKKEALWRRNYCPNCGAKMDATDNNVGGKIDSSDELPSWQQSMLRTFGGDADV